MSRWGCCWRRREWRGSRSRSRRGLGTSVDVSTRKVEAQRLWDAYGDAYKNIGTYEYKGGRLDHQKTICNPEERGLLHRQQHTNFLRAREDTITRYHLDTLLTGSDPEEICCRTSNTMRVPFNPSQFSSIIATFEMKHTKR